MLLGVSMARVAATSIICTPVAPFLVTIRPYCFQRWRVLAEGTRGQSPAACTQGGQALEGLQRMEGNRREAWRGAAWARDILRRGYWPSAEGWRCGSFVCADLVRIFGGVNCLRQETA